MNLPFGNKALRAIGVAVIVCGLPPGASTRAWAAWGGWESLGGIITEAPIGTAEQPVLIFEPTTAVTDSSFQTAVALISSEANVLLAARESCSRLRA